MEEINNENVHRSSVSMPSLDATDSDEFLNAPTADINAFEPAQSTFTSTASTETLISNPDGFTDNTLSLDNVATSVTENAKLEEDLEQGLSNENNTQVLPEVEPLDSQVEEDPSIVIDQFIKKIADEQLSSKRILVRDEQNKEELEKEFKEKEEEQTGEDSVDSSQDNVTFSAVEDPPVIESTTNLEHEDKEISSENVSSQEAQSNPLEEETENIDTSIETEEKVTEESGVDFDQPTPMDVDNVNATELNTEQVDKTDLTETNNVDELVMGSSKEPVQAESIEEIQKEIDKIPPKKLVSEVVTENAQNNVIDSDLSKVKNKKENQIEKDIQQLLEGEKVKSDVKKDLANGEKISSQDTSEVSKDPNIIQKAQEELKKMDVLVCGDCHNSFNLIEEFKDHKSGKCTYKSSLTSICENESKPQVWGFVLWKIKQMEDVSAKDQSSWSVYQKWCKLPQDSKNAWITAGQSIQFASKIGNAKVMEVKGNQTKQVVSKKIEETPPPLPIEFVDSNKENSAHMEIDSPSSNILRRSLTKPMKLNDVTIMPSLKVSSGDQKSNLAIRTTKVLSTQKQEFAVEKIVAKRFNPRKKIWEYQIKWENFGPEANTWEPINNLGHCRELLEQFEEQLKRVKEEKAKQQSLKSKARPQSKPNITQYVPIAPKLDVTPGTPKITNVVGGVSEDYAGSSRPTRSSKKKAMDQVKAWCGNISDEETSGGVKRRHEDDSDEDYDDKKVKLEDYSDESDKEAQSKVSIKKVSSTPKQIQAKSSTPVVNNGTKQILPSNILIPDANGVVRINQKQLPSLSSGVYIMSKTAGIIKLDSSTSKVATSGGQTIVKVAPKIGQTQIKIVKKEGNTTKQIIQVSPKPPISSTPIKATPVKVPAKTTPKIIPKVRKEVKKPAETAENIIKVVRKPETPKLPDPKPQNDDSDDGLEPLPFPSADEPLPEINDTDNEEFVLDPSTGKIAGVEYVDKPVVIKEEPQPLPPSTNDLENIVKLAAAEITENDTRHDIHMDAEPIETKPIIVPTVKSEPSISSSSTPVRRVVKYTVGQGMKTSTSDGSLLNKALTQTGQRAVIMPSKTTTPRTQVVQQKVINQMVTQRHQPGQTKTIVRRVISPQTSSSGNLIRKPISSTVKPKFNMAAQKRLPSPLQPTKTYSATGGIRQHIGGVGTSNKVQVYSTKSTQPHQFSQGGQTTKRMIGSTVVKSSSGHLTTTQRTQSEQPTTRIVQRVVTSPKKAESPMILNTGITQSKATYAKPKAVINMPSLTDDDTAFGTVNEISKSLHTEVQKATPKMAQSSVSTTFVKEEPKTSVGNIAKQADVSDSASGTEASTDWSSFTMADGDNPIYVTGDDGTIYQVAGQNEQGQTILITQDADGQQQCLLVTNEIGADALGTEEVTSNTAAIDIADAQFVSQESDMVPTNVTAAVADNIQAPLHIKTDSSEMEEVEEGIQDQVVAQVVRAEPPSPGGTHKVVVMLPDGNLMVTQVSPEEYASLELE